jgi:hypothetical protein
MSALKNLARDVLAGKLQLSEKELSDERMKVCVECPSFRKLTRQCALCGCFLELKTKILQAECPIGRW